jgi:hypothetical protein
MLSEENEVSGCGGPVSWHRSQLIGEPRESERLVDVPDRVLMCADIAGCELSEQSALSRHVPLRLFTARLVAC